MIATLITTSAEGMSLTESIVEDAALEWFVELGYAVGHKPQMAPGEPAADWDDCIKSSSTSTMMITAAANGRDAEGKGGKSSKMGVKEIAARARHHS